FFQAEDGIRVFHVTGVQTCALPICGGGIVGAIHGGESPLQVVHHRHQVADEFLQGELVGVLHIPLDTAAQVLHVGVGEEQFLPRSEERRVGNEGGVGGLTSGTERGA